MQLWAAVACVRTCACVCRVGTRALRVSFSSCAGLHSNGPGSNEFTCSSTSLLLQPVWVAAADEARRGKQGRELSCGLSSAASLVTLPSVPLCCSATLDSLRARAACVPLKATFDSEASRLMEPRSLPRSKNHFGYLYSSGSNLQDRREPAVIQLTDIL